MQSGVGIDIVKINRIKKLYLKYGVDFLERIFNPNEIDYIMSKGYPVETIAGMFSMKESVAKALGTGISKGLNFRDIRIDYTDKGAPYGLAKDYKLKLSVSHDGDYVVSTAIKSNNSITLPVELTNTYLRCDNTHKGSYGKAMIYASSKGMIGAGYLTCMAALRSGCGLVYHYVDPLDNIADLLSIKHTEAIVRDTDPLIDVMDMDCVAFGPGVGQDISKKDILKNLLKLNIPLVIDADGINILDLKHFKKKKAFTIITPHIGEFKKLIDSDKIGDDLREQAKKFAKEYSTIVVLKDYQTYITDGSREYILDKPNSALSTPGSGDILTGVITSMVSQGYSLWDSALLGVNIHSLAGHISAINNSKTATIATDIIGSLKEVFVRLESVNES